MADEQGIHIPITASAGTALDAVSQLDSRLAKLEEAFKKAGKGAEDNERKLTGFFGALKKNLEGIESHAGKLGEIGSKLGGFGEAFKGLGDKAGAFGKALGAVPGPLMAITAGLAAVGGAAAFMKESADKAAQWQQSMDVLGRTVKDQGANWNTARKAVEDFADAQERATTYSRDDVVKAITQMTSAGMSYKDAMAEVRVAEDAASATGQSLMTVSHGLVEATHGRTQALTMLGIGTKASIKAGMTLYQMNAAIEKQMGGSAGAAAEGYAGKMQQLHNAFESLQEKIGSAVLPVLTKLATTLIGMVDAAEQQFGRWEAAVHAFYLRNKEAFDAIGKAVSFVWNGIKLSTKMMWAEVSGIFKAGVGVIMDVVTTFADLFTGHFDRLWNDVKNIFGDAFHNVTSGFGNFGDNLIAIAQRIGKAVAHAFEAPFAAMADALHGNFAKAKADLAGTFSGFGGIMSGLKPLSFGGGGASHADAESNPLLHLSAAAGNIMAGGGLGAHHAKHKKSGHSNAFAAADKDARLATQEIQNQALARGKNVEAINKEIAALEHELATHKLSAAERTRIEHQILALKAQETAMEARAERAKEQALKKHEAAVAAATRKEYDHVVKTLEEELKAHQITYAQMDAMLKSWTDAHKNASQAILDDAKTREATWEDLEQKQEQKAEAQIAKQQKAWDAYYKKLEQNAQQWADKSVTFIEGLFAKGKKGVNSFAQEFKSMLKQIEEALLKSALFEMFMGGQSAHGPSFMSVFAKNMGFGGNGATAPGSAPSGFSLASAAMSIADGGKGSALSGIAGMFGGGKGNQASADGSGGIIGALIGTSAATQLASSLPTDSLMSLMFGVGAPSMAGGLGGGSGAGSGGLGGVATVIAGGNGPGGGTILGSLASGASGLGGSGLSGLGGIKGIGAILGSHVPGGGPFIGMGTIGSSLLGAAGGYLVGTGIDKLLFGNQPLNKGGAIGGAIGGGLGSAFGPAIAALLGVSTGGLGVLLGPLLGSIGGSLIGGLFGNHDNPAQMPDKYNTGTFGQLIADLAGAGTSQYGQSLVASNRNSTTTPFGSFGANGQQFTTNIGDLTGGQSAIAWIEETLAKYAAPGTTQMGSNVPDWIKPIWNQLVQAFGVSSTGSGQLEIGVNGSGKNQSIIGVTGAAGVGGQQNYQQYEALLQQFVQNYLTQGAVSTSPYTPPGNPNFGSGGGFSVTSPFAGAYTVGTPGSTPQLVNGDASLPTFSLNTPGGSTTPGGNTIGGGAAGATLPGGRHVLDGSNINVTVNVQGNVTAESDLKESIKKTIVDEVLNNRFSNSMALSGGGIVS